MLSACLGILQSRCKQIPCLELNYLAGSSPALHDLAALVFLLPAHVHFICAFASWRIVLLSDTKLSTNGSNVFLVNLNTTIEILAA